MPFSPEEREALLTVKGVGPTVVQRLEEMGITALAQLSRSNTPEIVAHAAALLGASC